MQQNTAIEPVRGFSLARGISRYKVFLSRKIGVYLRYNCSILEVW